MDNMNRTWINKHVCIKFVDTHQENEEDVEETLEGGEGRSGDIGSTNGGRIVKRKKTDSIWQVGGEED